MKIITKNVIIENEEFVIIKDTDSRYGDYYGTISYKELDESGKLKRRLNGFDMCIEPTLAEAIERRKNHIITERKIQELIERGYDKETAIIAAFSLQG